MKHTRVRVSKEEYINSLLREPGITHFSYNISLPDFIELSGEVVEEKECTNCGTKWTAPVKICPDCNELGVPTKKKIESLGEYKDPYEDTTVKGIIPVMWEKINELCDIINECQKYK